MISADVVGAEVKTYTGVGEYYMSDFETPEIAKQRAKQRAEQNACEKSGVYVKSFSRTINLELDEDVIETMTSGILKIVNVQYYHENSDNDTTLFRVTIQAQIDDADIKNWLKKDLQEISTLVSQNEALRKSNEELARQIAELKKQIPQAKTEADKERITQEFAAEDRKFLSNQKVDEGWKLCEQKDFNSAISLFNEAINLNSDNANAWYSLGVACSQLNQYERAIIDFTRAIKLDPNFFEAYNNRGIAYVCQYLDTHLFDSLRGFTYRDTKPYERAIQDFNKAIELDSKNALSYKNRGAAYFEQQQYERALRDFNKALEINPHHVLAKVYREKCLEAMGK